MNPGAKYNIAVQCFFSAAYQVTKTSQLVLLVKIVTSQRKDLGNDHNGSLSIRLSQNVELLEN